MITNNTNRKDSHFRRPHTKKMNGSPVSSTPTAMREASRSGTPDILRDSSLLQSDESVIAEQTHQSHSDPEPESKKIISEDIMADKGRAEESTRGREARGTEVGEVRKEEEAQILEELSEEKIRLLENRRRGRVQSKMDETPIGAEVEEVKTPQSQKAKTKEEKSKKNINRKTPEMVRDTPRKNMLRSGNSKETEDDS